MKKQILFVAITVVLCFSSLNLLSSANPLPVPKHGSSPMNHSYNGSIEFFSEEVIYTIDDSDDAEVDADYVFRNKKNETVTKTIILPFVDIPSELQIRKNGIKISYNKIGYDLRLNGTIINDAVSFNLTFKGNELITINARYLLTDTVNDIKKSDYTQYSCRYLSETGSSWNNSLKYANFSFRIKNSLYTGGISGFYVREKGDYVIASKNLTDWSSDENIEISWRGPVNDWFSDEFALLCCGVMIIIGVVIIVVIIFFIKKMSKKDDKDNVKNFTKSCFYCGRVIPFDSKVCPYCGNKV